MDVEETVSRSKNKFVVICDPIDTEPHNCGVFTDIEAAKTRIRDDHGDTGISLDRYTIECWRGRQFNGLYNHEGRLVETRKGEVAHGQEDREEE
jgi:hypothetical protein